MKKIISLVWTLLFPAAALAAVGPLINGNQINPQTAISIATFTQTGAANTTFAGKVGVQTTTPATTLDVNGNAQFGNSVAKSSFSTGGELTFPNNVGITAVNSGGNPFSMVRLTNGNIVRIQSDSPGDAVTIGGNPQVTATFINGSVGISTGIPQVTLDVNGNELVRGNIVLTSSISLPAGQQVLVGSNANCGTGPGLCVDELTSGDVAFLRNVNGAQLRLLNGTAPDVGIYMATQDGTSTNNSLNINNSGTHLFTVANDGKVGIGVLGNAATLLDVTGNAQFGSGVSKSTFSASGALTLASGAALTLSGSAGTIISGSSITGGAFYGYGGNLSGVTASVVPAAGVQAGSLGAGVIASSIAANGTTAGSYGSASAVGTFTVGGNGVLTAASNTSIQIAESAVTNLVSDLATKASTGTDNSMVRANALQTLGASQVTAVGTMTVQGNAFSVGVSTFVVSGGKIGIGVASPTNEVTIQDANNTNVLIKDSVNQPDGISFQYARSAGGNVFSVQSLPAIAVQVGFGGAGQFSVGNDAADSGSILLSPAGVDMQPAEYLNWRSGAFGGFDTGIRRNAAGVVEIDNGAAGSYANLIAGQVSVGTSVNQTTITASGVTLPNNASLSFLNTGLNPFVAVKFNASNQLVIQTDSPGNPVYIGQNPNVIMTLNNGKVGIDTTTPATNLDVAGNVQIGLGATKSTFSTTGALTLASGAALTLSGSAGTIVSGSSVTGGAFYGNGANLTGITASAVPASGVQAGSLGASVIASSISANGTTAGSYGSASAVGTFTVGGNGVLTAASNTSIQIAESAVTNLTTDLAAKASTGTDNSMTRANALATIGTALTTTSSVTIGGDLSVNGSTLTTSGGAVSAGSQPGAKARQVADESLASTVIEQLFFGDAACGTGCFNQNNVWNSASSGTFVTRGAGTYDIQCEVVFSGALATTLLSVYIADDTANDTIFGIAQTAAGSTNTTVISAVALNTKLANGQNVQCNVRADSIGVSALGSTSSFLSIQKKW